MHMGPISVVGGSLETQGSERSAWRRNQTFRCVLLRQHSVGGRKKKRKEIWMILEKASVAQFGHKPRHSLLSSIDAITHSVTCLGPKGSDSGPRPNVSLYRQGNKFTDLPQVTAMLIGKTTVRFQWPGSWLHILLSDSTILLQRFNLEPRMPTGWKRTRNQYVKCIWKMMCSCHSSSLLHISLCSPHQRRSGPRWRGESCTQRCWYKCTHG